MNKNKEMRDPFRAVEGKDRFYLADGSALHSLHELRSALPSMNSSVFEAHVGDDKHDFASWTAGVFGHGALANKMRGTSTKEELHACIDSHVSQAEFKLTAQQLPGTYIVAQGKRREENPALHTEIERLTHENLTLRRRIGQLERKITGVQRRVKGMKRQKPVIRPPRVTPFHAFPSLPKLTTFDAFPPLAFQANSVESLPAGSLPSVPRLTFFGEFPALKNAEPTITQFHEFPPIGMTRFEDFPELTIFEREDAEESAIGSIDTQDEDIDINTIAQEFQSEPNTFFNVAPEQPAVQQEPANDLFAAAEEQPSEEKTEDYSELFKEKHVSLGSWVAGIFTRPFRRKQAAEDVDQDVIDRILDRARGIEEKRHGE